MRKRARSATSILLACTRGRTRSTLLAVAVTGSVSRLVLVLAARQFGRGEVVLATAAAVAVGVATAVQRVAQASARVEVECDLYRAATGALVDGDPMRPPTRDVQHAFYEGEQDALGLVSGALPGLAADAVVCLAAVPILAAALPPRVLLIALVAFAVVIATLLFLRGAMQRMQARLHLASQRLFDVTLVAIEGSLELVARGGDEAFHQRLEATLSEYARISRRVGIGAALVGRAPLGAGLALVALFVVVDGASRSALAVTVVGEALLLAACLPPLLGVVTGVHGIFRTSARLGPFLEILGAERREELGRGGAAPPPPPFDIAIDGVSYRYDASAADVLAGIASRWPRGGILLVSGPNGAGKSTLLRLLLALGKPRAGTITYGALDAQTLDVARLRRSAAYLPQRPYLGQPYESVRAAMHLARPDATDASITSALARVGVLAALSARAGDPLSVTVGGLSAGQRQRVGLARVLVQRADVVVLDEPDANLDREGVALVASLVQELSASGAMVAVAAHTEEVAKIATVRIALGALDALGEESQPLNGSETSAPKSTTR